MAAPGGLTFPLLEGVEPSYTHRVGAPLAAALAARLIEVELADPADWSRAERDPMEFLEVTLQEWQRAAGGEAVGDDYVYVGAGILSDLRSFFWEEAQDDSLERMWVLFEHEHQHDLVEMRHTVALLEQVHPRLPATFYHWLLGAVNTVGYAWDAYETGEFFEMYGDWIIEREADARLYAEENGEEYEPENGWPIELTESDSGYPLVRVKEMRLPALLRKPLAESSVRRLLPRLTPRPRKIMELALQLRDAARSVDVRERGWWNFTEEYELYEISHRIPPVVVLPMERYDAIERGFDEENMAMSQMGEPVPPLLAFHFDATDDDDLRWAHEMFTATVRTYAVLAELLPLLPTDDPSKLVESLVEVEVS